MITFSFMASMSIFRSDCTVMRQMCLTLRGLEILVYFMKIKESFYARATHFKIWGMNFAGDDRTWIAIIRNLRIIREKAKYNHLVRTGYKLGGYEEGWY